MGRWACVACGCADRRPLDEQRPWSAEYACGHRNGLLVELSPRWLVKLAEALRRTFDDHPDWLNTFEIFQRIADEGSYREECLTLSAAERELWQLEIREVARLDAGAPDVPHQLAQRWLRCWPPPAPGEEPQTLAEVLASATALCEASLSSGQPVEFFM